MIKKDKVTGGAFVLGLGTFIAKLLGALYRIPLTKIIGSCGIGLYQMVFPVYTVLLEFSGAGAPNAIAKIISSTNKDKEVRSLSYLRTSLIILFITGLISSLLMIGFSKIISFYQGNENAWRGYITLAPSLLFVCLISAFRGYFQGNLNMLPTAVSQIIEQFIKLVFGLFLAYFFVDNLSYSVAGTTFAITLSELIALIFLFIYYKNKRKNLPLTFAYNKKIFIKQLKKIIKVVIPITLIGIIIPLSQVADSFIIINTVSKYFDNATSLFGLFSGVALTVINLPVAICYGISSVAIPSISSSIGKEKSKNVKKVIVLTIAVSLPCAIAVYFFSPLMIKILFRSLSNEEIETASKILKILSPTVVLLALVQTTNAVLIGKNKIYYPIISLSISVIIKIIIEFILLRNKNINIYGACISLITCYFVCDLINLIMIFLSRKDNGNSPDRAKRLYN